MLVEITVPWYRRKFEEVELSAGCLLVCVLCLNNQQHSKYSLHMTWFIGYFSASPAIVQYGIVKGFSL
jgi:hypothetical protein